MNALPVPAAEPVVELARVSERCGAGAAVDAASLGVRRGEASCHRPRPAAMDRAGTGIGAA